MILRNTRETDERKSLFRLFFLKNDDDMSVEVEEIDFKAVKRHIEQGESVFITRRRKQEFSTTLVANEDALELWYFTRRQRSKCKMSVKSPKQLNASFKPQFLRGLISLVSFLSPFNKVFLLQKVEVVSCGKQYAR